MERPKIKDYSGKIYDYAGDLNDYANYLEDLLIELRKHYSQNLS